MTDPLNDPAPSTLKVVVEHPNGLTGTIFTTTYLGLTTDHDVAARDLVRVAGEIAAHLARLAAIALSLKPKTGDSD